TPACPTMSSTRVVCQPPSAKASRAACRNRAAVRAPRPRPPLAWSGDAFGTSGSAMRPYATGPPSRSCALRRSCRRRMGAARSRGSVALARDHAVQVAGDLLAADLLERRLRPLAEPHEHPAAVAVHALDGAEDTAGLLLAQAP